MGLTEAFRADLRVDLALSEGQLRRHYGLDAIPAAVEQTTAFLAPTHHSRAFKPVRFAVASPREGCLPAASLRHLAGVAELRRLLGAPASDWSAMTACHCMEAPDALWEAHGGTVAVEYDAGSYAPGRILAKARAFRRHAGQVWGSPSEHRALRLTQLLRGLDAARVLYAPWT